VFTTLPGLHLILFIQKSRHESHFGKDHVENMELESGSHTLETFAEICDCHSDGGGSVHGIQREKARDLAEHSAVHRTGPCDK
jgi:hypothetical protein